MDQLLELTDANVRYEDSIGGGNWRAVHSMEFSDEDYELYISTRCHSTADTIKYLVAGTTEWQVVTQPTQPLYQVCFKYPFDEEDDLPVHTLIVWNHDVYQSCAGKYPLRRSHHPNLSELLEDPRSGWTQLTGLAAIECDLTVCYYQPVTYQLDQILKRYHQLTT